MSFNRSIRRKKEKEIGSKVGKVGNRDYTKKLVQKMLTKDEFIEDVLLALLPGFAKSVKENENIENTELSKGIADHTLNFYKDSMIVFRDSSKMKLFIKTAVEPLFSIAKTSSSIMMTITIKYLVDESNNNLAEYGFSAIKEHVDRLYDALEKAYPEELKQNETALKLITGESIISFKEKKAMKDFKIGMRALTTPEKISKTIENYEELVEMCFLAFTECDPKSTILSLWLIDEFKTYEEIEKYVTTSIRPYLLQLGKSKTDILKLCKDIKSDKPEYTLSNCLDAVQKGGLTEANILYKIIMQFDEDSYEAKTKVAFKHLKEHGLNSVLEEYNGDIVEVFEYKISILKTFIDEMKLKDFRNRVKNLGVYKRMKDAERSCEGK